MTAREFRRSCLLGVGLWAASTAIVWAAYGHGGGVDASGCHTERKSGTEHCHGARTASTAVGQRVVDGDTFKSGGVSYRLWGVDAVEGDQICVLDSLPWPCGEDATLALQRLMDGQDVSCEIQDTDRYGRPVVKCQIGATDLGSEMVRQGWALDYVKYSGGAYAAEQAEAKAAKRGLWAGEFMPPWQWRKR